MIASPHTHTRTAWALVLCLSLLAVVACTVGGFVALLVSI